MDKRELYDSLEQMETFLQSTLRDVGNMKKTIQEIIEQNNTLQLENTRLRQRLSELSPTKDTPKEKTRAQLAMEKLYADGFHVCNASYGQRRDHDEDCMFCMDMIDTLND